MALTPEQLADRLHERNPFATRGVRPGTVPYLFPSGSSAESLVRQLQNNHWIGEIVGPHGSGKSALLHSLVPHLQAAGRDVVLVVLQAGERRLPDSVASSRWTPNMLVVIDGFEQLGWWSRWRLRSARRRVGCGLLVTTHASVGLPLLWRTKPTVEMTQELVRQLQVGAAPRIHDRDVAISFANHAGDVREVLFELHDLYEQRR